jgi:prepilin-type processing-associated H-X9-DG protein
VFYQQNSSPWMPSAPASEAENAARSKHINGVNASMCDGSVQFFTNAVPIAVWQAMGTANGGEVIPSY